MEILDAETLRTRKCSECAPGTPAATSEETASQLAHLEGWYATHDGKRIRRDWKVKNFMAGMVFFEKIAAIAEADNHHPDLHIEGYRNVWIEMWTHTIDGISPGDFIMAAKIDAVPVDCIP